MRNTTRGLEHLPAKGTRKLVMLTCYDAQMARILASLEVDMLLVGDTLGNVFQGNADTHTVTMEQMLYHTEAVLRGSGNKPVISDMPIHSCDSPEMAAANARRFMEIGAAGVKLEGAYPEVVRALVSQGIPVMGHLGLLPQTAEEYKVVGKKPAEARALQDDALKLADAGVFSMVLECVPESLAREITELVPVPTIGIGAGVHTDGQVLVINDLLGMEQSLAGKFVRHYAELNSIITAAVREFSADVRSGAYPDAAHTYH